MIREEILDIKPYVPGKPIEEVKRELGLDDIIKLASNENPLGPSPKAIEAMQETAKEVNLYPDGNCYQLRDALCSRLGIAEDEIIFGNGSDGLLKLIAETFLNPGEEVIAADTTFSQYEFVAQVMGGQVTEVPLRDDYTHDLEAMAAAVTEQTKLVFVCNPNNPTGTIVTQEEVESFLTAIPDDVIVIFDEAYKEYVTADNYPETLDYLAEYDNVIISRTFSKAYGLAGLRVGYCIAQADLISYISRVRPPFEVNLMSQRAAVAALEDRKHLTRSREVNSQGKEYLYQEFERLDLDYVPTETNFILVDVDQDPEALFNRMLKQGVIIRNTESFGLENKIRVTIGTPEQNERLINTLEAELN
ncbi:MAG: histidinol-phosphate transaminase [Bacillota bacterium]